MRFIILFIIAQVFLSCEQKKEALPFLGNPTEFGGKTTYPKVMDFTFTDQNGKAVSNATFDGKVYIADFIFLSCPTICPRMTIEMDKVYKIYKNNDRVNFLSHTIDPSRDTQDKLKAYADNLGADRNWYFVRGESQSIYTIATDSYFTTAYPDAKEPGGYVHSGALLLIDQDRHIRGVYDGTDPKETNRLIKDIESLLKEN